MRRSKWSEGLASGPLWCGREGGGPSTTRATPFLNPLPQANEHMGEDDGRADGERVRERASGDEKVEVGTEDEGDRRPSTVLIQYTKSQKSKGNGTEEKKQRTRAAAAAAGRQQRGGKLWGRLGLTRKKERKKERTGEMVGDESSDSGRSSDADFDSVVYWDISCLHRGPGNW
ncbi:hypothetical protein AXG93_107s1200 [Marchantia polymorpha subsp. ruderalis]|uniref:Uncharacterized protein n=1 Tax=Marchantia polymorpha subsp. ruderalis TaxID=1480154 RepID=A0A176WHY2_MARPO|nr:hypothetical protein AXG93_107s1200 [Marchantia polymorpha subsp. ruderalis]